jgi:WD40 repeat protein
MRSRINVGMAVEISGSYLNLRAQPSINAPVLMQVPSGWMVKITAGPDCIDGYVWWLALVDGQTGYIAEAGESRYLVAPEPPPALPSREIVNRSLAPFLREFGRISGNFLPAHDWSSDSRFLLLPGAPGSDGVWVYDLRHPVLTPQILALDAGISALAFRPNSAQFVIGSATGELQLWQIHDSDPLTFSERLFLNAHAGPISALAFSPDGNRLVSAGSEAYTHVDVNRDWAAIVWDLEAVAQQAILSGNGELIRMAAFSPDASAVFTAGDGSRRVWDAGSGALLGSFGAASALAAAEYNPAGSQFAWAQAPPGDSLLILEPGSFAQLASYPLPTRKVTSLGFSPDGAMLVVGAAEGVFSIWDTNTHQTLATRETDGAIRDVSFSPDGATIAVSTDKHELILYGVPLGSG